MKAPEFPRVTRDSHIIWPASWKERFRRRLRAWYRRNARNLPWRRDPTAYQVWVSEIMLQQTQVETVKPYFERFLAEFPTVVDLATADEAAVLRQWEGLGYYRRARQLHAAAKSVMDRHAGQFPRYPQELQALPGIGRYTAGAIASLAYGLPAPILEANTVRLWSRLLAVREDPRQAGIQKLLWRAAEDILPRRDAAELNQALMDLGSLVCKPRQPLCETCPAKSLCPTRAHGLQDVIPARAKRPATERVTEVAAVVWDRQRVLLGQRGPNERWAGLWDFVRFPWKSGGSPRSDEVTKEVARRTGLPVQPRGPLPTLRHGVTRFAITLRCFEFEREQNGSRQARPARPYQWWPIGKLSELPLHKTARKIAHTLQEKRARQPFSQDS